MKRELNIGTFFTLGIFIIIMHWVILYRYSLNVPILDDFLSVLQYLNRYVEIESGIDKILFIFAPYNEYKLVLSNCVQITLLWIFAEIDFRMMVFVASLGLVAIMWIYIFYFYNKFYKGFKISIWYFMPVVFLLFNLSQYDFAMWSMAALQGYTQMAFSLGAVYFFAKRDMFWTLFFLVCGMFQGGMWMPTLAIFVFASMIKKEYKNLYMMLFVAFVSIVFMYVTDMNAPAHDLMKNLGQKWDIILFAFGVLGSITGELKSAYLLGMIEVVVFGVFVFWRKDNIWESFAFLSALIIMMASAALAINRIHTGIESCILSRYSLVSIIFTISLYFFVLEQTKQMRESKNINGSFFVFLVFLVAGIGLYGIGFYKFYMKENKYEYANFYFNTPSEHKTTVENILKESNEKNIYYSPKTEQLPWIKERLK